MRTVQNWRIRVLAEQHMRRAVKHAIRKRSEAIADVQTARDDAAKPAQVAAPEGEEVVEADSVVKMKGETEEEMILNAELESDAAAAAAEFAFDASSASLQASFFSLWSRAISAFEDASDVPRISVCAICCNTEC
jgi:hypothetical protein